MTEILRFFNNWFPNPKYSVQKIVKIYDTMHFILEETPVERFLIFKAHNGGGVIKPNTPVYSSVLYEDYTGPFKAVKNQYQRMESDEYYLRMLVEMIQKKAISLSTREMPDSSIKTIYEGEGVKYAEVYFLGNDRKNIYYCSCGTSVEGGWETDHYSKGQILVAINTLRQNIK